jgi:hypothetical protein
MPNDAKIGLAVGVGLVIGVAVMFYSKDSGPIKPVAGQASASPIQATVPPPAPRDVSDPIKPPTIMGIETANLNEPREITASPGRQEPYRGQPDR